MRSSFRIVLALALGFVAAVFVQRSLAGSRPEIFLDTVNDERFVKTCLDLNWCTLWGPTTSVGPLRIGVTWVELRSLVESLGVSLDLLHVLLLGVTAFAVVLAGAAAARIGGTWAGAAAALGGAALLAATDMRVSVVYTNRLLIPVGALAFASAVGAVGRGLPSLVLAAAAAAVATEIHLVGGLLLFPLLALAWVHPRRRVALPLALGVYGALVLALAPEAWVENARVLLSGWRPLRPGTGGHAEHWFRPAEILAVLGALTGTAAAFRAPRGSLERHRLVVALANLLPPLAVIFVARQAGAIDVTDKYLALWLGSVIALAAAGPVALLAPVVASGRERWLRAGGAAAVAILFYLMLLPIRASTPTASLSMGDVPVLSERLAARGWDLRDAASRLSGPAVAETLEALAVLSPPGPAAGAKPGPRDAITVLAARRVRVPTPLPAGWEILGERDDGVSLLVPFDGWVDRSSFEVCFDPPPAEGEPCRATGPAVDWGPSAEAQSVFFPGLPVRGEGVGTVLTFRFPVRPPPSGPDHRVRSWTGPLACTGTILGVPHGGVIEDGGRAARLPAGGRPGELVVRWQLGMPECDRWSWHGHPPFLLEGDDATVEALAAVLAPEVAP